MILSHYLAYLLPLQSSLSCMIMSHFIAYLLPSSPLCLSLLGYLLVDEECHDLSDLVLSADLEPAGLLAAAR